MPYVAPSTKSAYTTLTATEWNTVVNDIIDMQARSMNRGLYSARPVAPSVGDLYYQTNTDELIKYVTDADGQNRWMQADHDYRRNLVINGSFDVSQRGSVFNPASSTSTSGLNYGCDRWQFLQSTSSAAAFVRVGIDRTDPPMQNYFVRCSRASGTFTTPFTIQTSFESQNIKNIRGKYLTLSFWARAGANYSAASGFLVSNIVTGTGTDNTVGNFTSNTVNTTANNVLTTSWKRFTVTTSAPIATSIGQLGISFVFTPTGTAGAADYYDITGVQLEVGTAPSDFEYCDIGEELRRCQRYYYRFESPGSQGNGGVTFHYTTTEAWASWYLPVTMRTNPSCSTSGALSNASIYTSTSIPVVTSVNFNFIGPNSLRVRFNVASGLVAGQSGFVSWVAPLVFEISSEL